MIKAPVITTEIRLPVFKFDITTEDAAINCATVCKKSPRRANIPRYFLKVLLKYLPISSTTVIVSLSLNFLEKKIARIKQAKALEMIKIREAAPYSYAICVVPIVEAPPTRVPIIIYDTPELPSFLPATVNSA